MQPEMERPARSGQIATGLKSRPATADGYLDTTSRTDPATDAAAALIARRFGLTPHMARLVCFLAEIGRRAA